MTSLLNNLLNLIIDLGAGTHTVAKGTLSDEVIHILAKSFADNAAVAVAMLSSEAVQFLECSDEAARQCTTAQLEAKQGPLLAAVDDVTVKLCSLKDSHEEYPDFFAELAENHSFSEALFIPLAMENGSLAITCYYFRAQQHWQEDELQAIESLSTILAWQLCSRRIINELSLQVEQLEKAIESRDIIGQAKGILMVQQHITAEQAFALLRSKSQVLNKKLREVAEFVSFTGELPSKDHKKYTDKKA